MQIGVTSDTHIPDRAAALPEKMKEDFSEVDEIIHAGDLTSGGVKAKLEHLAALTAVSGNCDKFSLNKDLSKSLTVKREGFKISVYHGYGLDRDILTKLSYKFPGSSVVVFGHTHNAQKQWNKGQLFLNPGSPTVPRGQSFGSYAVLNIDKEEGITAEIKKV